MIEFNENPSAFFDTNGALLYWDTALPVRPGWTGIARRKGTLFFVGKDGAETTYTALQAKTMAEARTELQGRIVLVFNELRFLELSCKEDLQATRAHGFYAQFHSGIHLYKADRTLEAFLLTSRERGYFAVTATRHESGAIRYMFSTTSETELWLHLNGKSWSEENDLVRGIQYDALPRPVGARMTDSVNNFSQIRRGHGVV